ncbi:MAG: hypothetical protein MUO58_07905 [Anaerolineales bacterium]|nr:hypothetical protein [Anaerolineales bacterium]
MTNTAFMFAVILIIRADGFAGDELMEKQGFHRWVWLVIFLLGGLLMICGGAQDIFLYFADHLTLVPSWHSVPPIVGLVCGLIVLASAVFNVIRGWQLRRAEGERERILARQVCIASGIGMIADWVSGYYGFGSLMALLAGAWLARQDFNVDA